AHFQWEQKSHRDPGSPVRLFWRRRWRRPAHSDNPPALRSLGGQLFRKDIEFEVLEVSVKLTLSQKLAMFTCRLDAAVMDQENGIARANCGDSMRQKDDSSPLKNTGKSIVKHCLRIVVEDRAWFLDDKNGGIAQNGPRQRDAKTLAGRKRMAEVAHR